MRQKDRFQTAEDARKETQEYITAGIRDPELSGWPAKSASQPDAATGYGWVVRGCPLAGDRDYPDDRLITP